MWSDSISHNEIINISFCHSLIENPGKLHLTIIIFIWWQATTYLGAPSALGNIRVCLYFSCREHHHTMSLLCDKYVLKAAQRCHQDFSRGDVRNVISAVRVCCRHSWLKKKMAAQGVSRQWRDLWTSHLILYLLTINLKTDLINR